MAVLTASDRAHHDCIEQSHQRCLSVGLRRQQAPELSPICRGDLAIARDRNRRLLAHAVPVMELLYEQVVNSQSMVLLTDARGTVIHSIGDDDFLSRASKVALQPGADWSESIKGTNAIGTALVSELPTLVFGTEHFLQAHQFLTCSAVPIHDPRGNVLGVIDVTGDHRLHHRHTMGLVKMSARMIENHWMGEDFRDVLRIRLHSRAEFIGTLMEGLVAVSREGRVLGANRSALEHLGLSGAAARMHSVTSLFGLALGELVDLLRAARAAPVELRLPDGTPLQARGEGPWMAAFDAAPRGSFDAAAPVAAACAPAPVPMAAQPRVRRGGLRALDTGDARLHEQLQRIRRVLDRPIPILVAGETGTGKELLARAIHDESQRAAMPFVAVNCAAIPEPLIEAELFGYEEGAFTGARRKGAVGKIVHADGGTLFLDEIGDMPLALQARLLRVLQERQVVPLGGHKPIPVDVAVISASHRDLRTMVQAQSFREDLYYRLRGLSVRLPPLRERTDFAALVATMLAAQGATPTPRLSPALLERFRTCRWPGNLRQLFGVIQTAVAMAAGEPEIDFEHLDDDVLADADGLPAGAGPATPTSAVPVAAAVPCEAPAEAMSTSVTLEQLELDVIKRAVESTGGNISAASKQLGIARNTIYRRLRWNV